MAMRIEQATKFDVERVAVGMRNRDFVEFRALALADTREELAADLGRRYGDRHDVLCVWHGERRVAVGGLIETRPNVISLLFYATDNFADVVLPLTKFIKRELFPRYIKAGVHRIEALSMVTYQEAHDWLNLLGLSLEGVMVAYGKRREAFAMFAMVVNDPGQAGA